MRRLQCLDLGEARMKAGQGKKHMAEFCHCLHHHRVPTWPQLLSDLLHRLESPQGTWRLESSPICRESLAGMCCVWLPSSSVCCLLASAPSPRPRARNLKPFPGRRPQAHRLGGRKPDQERAAERGRSRLGFKSDHRYTRREGERGL